MQRLDLRAIAALMVLGLCGVKLSVLGLATDRDDTIRPERDDKAIVIAGTRSFKLPLLGFNNGLELLTTLN